jgi:PAS domain S-box-containing protein
MSTLHSDVIERLAEHLAPVFESSPDGVYIWLDEQHKACNERLAALFGWTVDEWRAAEPFLARFVAPDDRDVYSWHYQQRVATLAFPATFRFRGLRKDGSAFAAETDMIPLSFMGHAVAYHFVRQVGE